MIQPINLRRPSLSLVLVSAGIVSYPKPVYGQESWTDKVRHAVIMEAGAVWFDLTASTLEDYVEDNDIVPIKVLDFDIQFRREFEKTFPEEVLASADIYTGVPLTSLEERIGWVNYVTDIIGGDPPWGQVIGTKIYLQDFDVNDAVHRKKLAHELVHVSQYMELGYEGFRTEYLEAIARDVPFENYEEISLEKEAYNFEIQWPRVAPLKLKPKVPPKTVPSSHKQSIRDISDLELGMVLFEGDISSWSIKGKKMYVDIDQDGDDELCATYIYSSSNAGNTSSISCFVVGIGESGPRVIRDVSSSVGLECKCQSGKMVVTKYEYAPSDAQCCPSLSFVEEYVMKGNKLELKEEDENTITIDEFFHLNNWSPQFYNEIDEPTPCTIEYSSKNPKTHRTEHHVLENVKVNLFESRTRVRYVNFIETSDGERIPLEAIMFMRRQDNSDYELGNMDMESSVSGLPLHDFAFVGYGIDGETAGVSFFLTKDKGNVTIECNLENH